MRILRVFLPALLAVAVAACSGGAAVPPSSTLTSQSAQSALSLNPTFGAKPSADGTDGCPKLKTHQQFRDEHLEAAKIATDAIPSPQGAEFICVYQNKINPIQGHRLPDNEYISYANPKDWELRQGEYHCINLSNCFFAKNHGQPPGEDTTVACPSTRDGKGRFSSVFISGDVPTEYGVRYTCRYSGEHEGPLQVKLKDDEYISRLTRPQGWWGHTGCDGSPDSCSFVVTKVKGV
jgi:hypothetical protein